MFSNIITQCENNVLSMPCCHNDGRDCCCYSCLYSGFRDIPDEYDCDKKMSYYVLKYGSSYLSEIYHYLGNSQVLESLNKNAINILSLGCGFCPEYYAIDQYIKDKKLSISFQYCGFDNSIAWDKTRLSHSNIHYTQFDLLQPFNIQDANLIMLSKLFSTIYRHGLHNIFLSNLVAAINTSMAKNAILVFNDVNSIHMGRDVFDRKISTLFLQNNIRRYYTDNPPYKEISWIQIPQNSIVCPITALPFIEPINFINRNVFFEYKK